MERTTLVGDVLFVMAPMFVQYQSLLGLVLVFLSHGKKTQSWVRTMRNRYFLFVYGKFEAYTNSVIGEAELRGRIQFLYDEDHDVELRIFYGDDITSRFIEKGEDEND